MPPKGKKRVAKGPSTSTSQRRRRNQEPLPPPLPWPFKDAAHEVKFNAFKDRVLLPTKYVDPYTIDHLELRTDVNAFINNIGWNHFISLTPPTFKETTLEFLSSFSSQFSPYEEPEFDVIHFRCLGQDRSMSVTALNTAFAFPTEGARWFPASYSHEQAWNELTGQSNYSPSQSKSTQLRNPALRYIHRFLSHSIFGRGDSTGVVTRNELFILWAMVHNIKVNTGAWLIKHIIQVARSTTGKIRIGGLITIIANAFDFIPEVGVHTLVEGSDKIDLDTLVHMKMCRYEGGGHYYLLDEQGRITPKQRTEPIDPSNQYHPQYENEDDNTDNWDMNTEPPMPSSGAGPSSSQSSLTLESMMDKIMDRFQRLETMINNNAASNATALARIEERLTKLEGNS